MTHIRGPVQIQASILQALLDGPLYHSRLREKTNLRGSTIYRHLDNLLKQQLITTWTEPYNPVIDLRYYGITEKGEKAMRYIQLTLDILGLPNLRSCGR